MGDFAAIPSSGGGGGGLPSITIARAFSVTAQLAPSTISPILYTVPATRSAKLTFSFGGPQGLQGAANFFGMTGNLLFAAQPSAPAQLALSTIVGNPAGPWQISFIETFAGPVFSVLQNQAGQGLVVQINSLVATNTQMVTFLNNYFITNFPAVNQPTFVLTNAAHDGPLIARNFNGVNMALSTYNNAPANMRPLVNGNVPTANSDIMIAAGDQVAIENQDGANTTSYNISVTEYVNS